MKLIPLSLFLFACTLAGCSDDSTSNTEPPYVRVKILQPDNGQVVRDTLLRVITSLDKNCGCTARVEFFVDGNFITSDYTPAYYFDWNIRDVKGSHIIRARGIVEGQAEGSDSVSVTINP